MDPVMVIGLDIGTLDFDLIRGGIKNLLIASAFSAIT